MRSGGVCIVTVALASAVGTATLAAQDAMPSAFGSITLADSRPMCDPTAARSDPWRARAC